MAVEEFALDSANQDTENRCTIDDSSTRHGEELITSNDINLDEQIHHNIDNAVTPLIGVKQLLPKALFISTHQTRDADYVSHVRKSFSFCVASVILLCAHTQT